MMAGGWNAKRVVVRSRAGWTRLSRPGHKTEQHWVHDASGWHVRHCGHMTALWPYYAVDPAFPQRATVTFNGLGFRSLDEVMRAVEGILAGELEVTNERCTPGTRRMKEVFG